MNSQINHQILLNFKFWILFQSEIQNLKKNIRVAYRRENPDLCSLYEKQTTCNMIN